MNSLLISVLPVLVAASSPEAAPPAPTPAMQAIREAVTIVGEIGTELRLSPETIEVVAGTTVTVTIPDVDGYSIHATIVDAAGSPIEDWDRRAHGARHTFPDVRDTVYSAVMAVSDTDPADVIYGPVVVVKPKG